jgi:hypothetical protein
MRNFLENVLVQLKTKHDNLENQTFVVPSKRASTFLNKYLSSHLTKPIFAPQIFSIEEFIANIASLDYTSNTELLFELYASYSSLELVEKEDFNSFLKWGQTLLQDFNEINRYLINHQTLFSYLSSIQKLKNWGVVNEQTELITNYLNFWNSLPTIYQDYNSRLLKKKKGYQGLVYQKAYENTENFLKLNTNKSYLFIGFNALNNAESSIIQQFLEYGNSEIYFDIDSYFLDDPIHSASYFIRNYIKTWKFFNTNKINGVTDSYISEKSIQIIGVPKSVSQAKYVGNLLEKLNSTNKESLNSAALVLADENLLEPILNTIPNYIKEINITMGLSITKSPIANFFDALFDLQINKGKKGFFYQDVLKFLSNPFTHIVLKEGNNDYAKILHDKILNNNWVFLDLNHIESAIDKETNLLYQLFSNSINTLSLLKLFQNIIETLKSKMTQKIDSFYLEQLYHIYKITNQVEEHFKNYNFIVNLKSLKSLFFELLSSETLDFRGNPTQGLQIMGMLESRVLDFETVIITSVNEGILPSGKSNNSFIPYDVKQEFGLPTYKEKDAIYTYHFYRLLQRAKNVYLIYNTEPDVLEGGEKSRFINQLLTDENINQHVTHTIAAPSIRPNKEKDNSVIKSPLLLKELKLLAYKGFSPTSLSNYIRNPLDFYRKSILRINTADEVEESIALNTFGTIIHDSLEDLYRPFIGQVLSSESLSSLKNKVPITIEKNFAKSNPTVDLSKGKNLIIYNVIIKYLNDFIDNEIAQVKKHEIKLLGVEESLKIQLDIPELDFPIILKGKIDRIDMIDGQLRIIDYKTGNVSSSEIEIIDWDELLVDKKYNKASQLLCYALMYRNSGNTSSIEAGIISIKKLSSGLLRFATKSSQRGSKNYLIDNEVLSMFQVQLKKLILEIFNPAIPFIEKEV